jgi:hypothetical protein
MLATWFIGYMRNTIARLWSIVLREWSKDPKINKAEDYVPATGIRELLAKCGFQ